MAAPAAMEEFKGSVAAVHTEKYWEPKLEELQSRWGKIKAKDSELQTEQVADLKGKPRPRWIRLNAENQAKLQAYKNTVYTAEESKLMEIGVSNAAYHYLGSAKIMGRIGKGFAESMVDMSESKTTKKKKPDNK
jgi:hypothetical protein